MLVLLGAGAQAGSDRWQTSTSPYPFWAGSGSEELCGNKLLKNSSGCLHPYQGHKLTCSQGPVCTQRGSVLCCPVTRWGRLHVAGSLDMPRTRSETFDVNSFGFKCWRLIRLLKSAKQNLSVGQSHSVATGVQPRVCKIKSACLTLASRPCLVCPHPHGPPRFLDTLPPPSRLPVLPGPALAHFVQTRGLMSHVRHEGPRVEVPLCLGPQVDTQVLLPPLPSCWESASCSLSWLFWAVPVHPQPRLGHCGIPPTAMPLCVSALTRPPLWLPGAWQKQVIDHVIR